MRAPPGPFPLTTRSEFGVTLAQGSQRPLQPAESSPARPSAPGHSHEHGAADQEEEVKAAVISEEGVPDADDVRQQELLGQQQRQPAEGEELGLDVLLLLGRQRRAVGARIRVGWLPCDIMQSLNVHSDKQQGPGPNRGGSRPGVSARHSGG